MRPSDPIEKSFRLQEKQKNALIKIGLNTIENLLYHFPSRYGNSATVQQIADLQEKTPATIFGRIKKIKTGKTFRGRMPMADATITDGTRVIRAVWFNQPYIARLFTEGTFVRLDGMVGKKNKSGQFTIANPKIERVEQDSDPTRATEGGLFSNENSMGDDTIIEEKFFPVYPESKGVTSNWFFHNIKKVLASGVLDELKDPIPDTVRAKYNLPNLKTALIWIHNPQKNDDALAARKRFAFEEIFIIQVNKQLNRAATSALNSYKISKTKKDLAPFLSRFPFELTKSQAKSVSDILKDMKKNWPMSRLIEGDVGSGKTVVAAAAAYAVIQTAPAENRYSNLQVAYMAPTEILAKQHFENFIQYFEGSGVQIALITGSGCYKFPSKVSPKEFTKISRAQLLKWVASGEVPIVLGTHALISKNVEFKNLALVIIDEQHRFGTKQRQALAQKEGFAPHLLSMTATPIPRTLSLTIYGDLDLSLIDQMPLGRKPIITKIITPKERAGVYEEIRNSLHAGRQAYVICPRINEPDPEKQFAIYAKSVEEESARLQREIFPDFVVGKMHSKMTPAQKTKVMADFESGKIDILVSTSVVEVGVNVPNSTNIIIEGAERFGLSQLHQLRGRVIRSNHQAYCYIFTDSKSEVTLDRLNALVTAKNGFELSEKDLELRGAGELVGNKQWGITDLGMEAIKNLKMVEAAREAAEEITEEDASLEKWPALKQKMDRIESIHFE